MDKSSPIKLFKKGGKRFIRYRGQTVEISPKLGDDKVLKNIFKIILDLIKMRVISPKRPKAKVKMPKLGRPATRKKTVKEEEKKLGGPPVYSNFPMPDYSLPRSIKTLFDASPVAKDNVSPTTLKAYIEKLLKTKRSFEEKVKNLITRFDKTTNIEEKKSLGKEIGSLQETLDQLSDVIQLHRDILQRNTDVTLNNQPTLADLPISEAKPDEQPVEEPAPEAEPEAEGEEEEQFVDEEGLESSELASTVVGNVPGTPTPTTELREYRGKLEDILELYQKRLARLDVLIDKVSAKEQTPARAKILANHKKSQAETITTIRRIQKDLSNLTEANISHSEAKYKQLLFVLGKRQGNLERRLAELKGKNDQESKIKKTDLKKEFRDNEILIKEFRIILGIPEEDEETPAGPSTQTPQQPPPPPSPPASPTATSTPGGAPAEVSGPSAPELPPVSPDEAQQQQLENEILEGGGQRGGLWNSDIRKLMSKFKPFIGVYARDQVASIPEQPHSKYGFIMNTKPISEKYGHWIAVLIDHDKKDIEYFDPFGDQEMDDFKSSIEHLLDNAPYQFKVNAVKRQNSNNQNCGYHAMKFLVDRFKGKTFKQATGFDIIEKSAEGEKELKPFIDKIEAFGTI